MPFQNLQCIDADSSNYKNGGDNLSSDRAWKDPWKMARKYQLEFCQKAVGENVIVYMGTGSGKTLIAVLLIYRMAHLIRKPQSQICVFVAPTVILVEQQAGVIKEFSNFKVETYHGSSKNLSNHRDWDKVIEENEVLVMTPEILVHNLCHCFIKMENIALLIFDECHHAQLYSEHPYAEIMKVFYRKDAAKSPRIFGMTASPVLGKGSSVAGLEALLHAKVYTTDFNEDVGSFLALPKVNAYYYDFLVDENFSLSMSFFNKLEDIKRQCVSLVKRKAVDHIQAHCVKKVLSRLHGNLLFCLQHIGVCGALIACDQFLNNDQELRNELLPTEGDFSADVVCDEYLAQATSVLSNPPDGGLSESCGHGDLLMPSFSPKLLCLVDILSSFRLQPNMKCIIFVNRIIVARSLAKILQNIPALSSCKCDFLVGIHSGLKRMSRKRMGLILKKFQYGEVNLLVATKVGEEGLDIQTCCLVIRFDLPDNLASFIQSRGRARMPQSEYALMIERGNRKELDFMKTLQEAEEKVNKDISLRTFSEMPVNFAERTYTVDLTGATISSGRSVSLLHHYCAKLPHDEYFSPKPGFFYFNHPEGTLCRVILPSNAPIYEITSLPQHSRDLARRNACLKACEQLHKVGALTSYLLPGEDMNDTDRQDADLSDSEDENSPCELHEVLVPTVLKEPWSTEENSVRLNCYFFVCNPIPLDRAYMNFALFIKSVLPPEAEEMKLELHLARGRSVHAELCRMGTVEFSNSEIIEAMNFQEMFLKIILDRSEFMQEYVPLGENNARRSASLTHYLMLPVILDKYKHVIGVAWVVVQRCLSSPVFGISGDAAFTEIDQFSSYLYLKNGPVRMQDIENSLVFVPHKENFFFISGVLHDKNAYSHYKDSKTHADHLSLKFGIVLTHPDQPLLSAKHLFCLRNLVCNRKKENTEAHILDEHFFELAPEVCQLKIIGFSKDIGSTLSLLPSIMYRLENLCVSVELRQRLCASFPEGNEVTTLRILEALTTESCNERFSLERLEILGDAFLKFSVSRLLFLVHDKLDEGYLTRKRSAVISNASLLRLALTFNMQVYIRDQAFDPTQYFALGRSSPAVCDTETETFIHSQCRSKQGRVDAGTEVRCSRAHHWLYKKTIADVVEALVGAFLVDSGFKAATAFLRWIGICTDFDSTQVENQCMLSEKFVSLSSSVDASHLENLLGYEFSRKGLLLEAFLHPSYNHPGGGCYQRLEFLGDAVLDYVVTSYFYSTYQKLKPGQLTELRSLCVNNVTFASVAVVHSLDRFLMCDSSGLSEAIAEYVRFVQASHADGDGPACPKTLGDIVESAVGAIFLDTGLDMRAVWDIVLSLLDPARCVSILRLNPVRELQEVCQYYGWKVQFLPQKTGEFFVEGRITGKYVSLSSHASNVNKNAAKRTAAERLCANLKAQGYKVKMKSLELEQVLKSSGKAEATLIGYDEEPLRLSSRGKEIPAATVEARTRFLAGGRAARYFGSSVSRPTVLNMDVDPVQSLPGVGGVLKGTAKSHLYEFCAASYWNPPLFECCKEEGPSHMRIFGFKVVVEMDEDPFTVLECYGAPQTTKRAAAEHAAEGAFWYLRQMGYMDAMR